jgi:hypothetical protein
LKIRIFATQVEDQRGGSKRNRVSARSGEGVRLHSLRQGRKRTAARNCLVVGLPANLLDVVSFFYHVNHEIIGRVGIKSECAFCDSVLSSPRMESLRALRRTQFLKHSRSKIDHYLGGECGKDTRNRALRRVTGGQDGSNLKNAWR